MGGVSLSLSSVGRITAAINSWRPLPPPLLPAPVGSVRPRCQRGGRCPGPGPATAFPWPRAGGRGPRRGRRGPGGGRRGDRPLCSAGGAAPAPAPVEAFSPRPPRLGRRFLQPLGLRWWQATRSSVPGVSMATTKILHKMHPRQTRVAPCLVPSRWLSARALPGVPSCSGRRGYPSSVRFGFSLSQEGWGRGVVKATGICNYLFIYLIFGL